VRRKRLRWRSGVEVGDGVLDIRLRGPRPIELTRREFRLRRLSARLMSLGSAFTLALRTVAPAAATAASASPPLAFAMGFFCLL
jgi:hypothetical protein